MAIIQATQSKSFMSEVIKDKVEVALEKANGEVANEEVTKPRAKRKVKDNG